MSKTTLVNVDESAFWYWINERHRIYLRKKSRYPKPWTEDLPMQRFKFTNVFRELDKGTVALRTMQRGASDDRLTLWNTIWYRMFNRYEHATDIGWNTSWEYLCERVHRLKRKGVKLFTSAHMTVGRPGEEKHITMLNSLRRVYEELDDLLARVTEKNTLYSAFIRLQRYMGIGPFIAYEIATDLRWSILKDATDIMTWANIGPGCKRGLIRLEMPVTQNSLRVLWSRGGHNLQDHVITHYHSELSREWPPFELREIEHSLCEFDKHQRVLHGTGRPRERYNGAS